MTAETTPEAGTTTYLYHPGGVNGAGQLWTLRRPAPNNDPNAPASTIDKEIWYDELGRPYTTGYYWTNTTAQVTTTPFTFYVYDVAPGWGSATSNLVGNLTEVWTQLPTVTTPTSADAFDYDSMNRVVHNAQCTPRTCTATPPANPPTTNPYLMTYAYNLAGEVTTLTNSASSVTYSSTYDSVGRLSQLVSSKSDSTHPPTLLSNITYGPFGPTGDTLGNGVAETFGYGNPASNQLPFLNSMAATLSGTTIYSLGLTVAGNGFVKGANDTVNGNWSYGYDSLNRMTSASKTGTALNWKYDVPGNRWQQNVTAGSGPQPQYTFNSGTNKIDGASYDAMGNLHQDFAVPTANTYTFDAEGRVVSVSGGASATYVYDGFGRRVKGPNYEYVYDLDGHPATLLAQSDGSLVGSPIFVGERHLATYFSSNTQFAHTDHLGTERVRTNATGTVCQTTTNLPFGDAQAYPTNSCNDPDGRTMGGMEYDPQTGLEHTLFRKYYSNPGRWMTPDPAGSEVADLTDPQTWNFFAYGANNPVSMIDPSGLEFISVGSCWFYREYAYVDGEQQGSTDFFLYCAEPDSPQATAGGGGGYVFRKTVWRRQNTASSNGPSFFTKLNTCIVNNAKNYSIGGVANLIFNKQIPGSSLASNSIADAYTLFTGQDGLLSSIWSATKTGFQWAAAASPPIMTNGPNSFAGINPARGAPQAILGNGTNYRGLWASAKRFAKSGAELKLAIDAGLSGALVLNCSLGQIK